MDIRAVVGRNVKQYREAKGLFQEQLAFEADLHRTYVSCVERGIRNPTVKIVSLLADALGIAAAKLLGEKG
jgi:transcriptional regulator with XRE-family HTH domain